MVRKSASTRASIEMVGFVKFDIQKFCAVENEGEVRLKIILMRGRV